MMWLIKRWLQAASPRYIPMVAGVEFVRNALMLVVLPTLGVRKLGLSMATIGVAISAHYLFDNALRPLFGYLADDIGLNALLGGGLLLSSAAMTGMVASRTPLALIAASAVFGMGTSALWPAVIGRLTNEVGDGERARALSAMYAAWMAASGCGVVVANAFIPANTAFFLTALAAILLGSGSYALLFPKRRPGKGSFHLARVVQNWIRDWGLLFTQLRDARWLFPGMYVQTLAIGLLIPVFSPYAKLILHDRPAQATLAMLVVGGVAIGALPLFGRLVDRIGSRPFLITGYLGAGIALALFTLQSSLWPAITTLALAGVCYAMILPAWNNVLNSAVNQERRAAMLGIFMMVEGLGTATGPFFSGELWVTGGPRAPFWATVLIVVGMAGLYSLLRHPALARH